MILRHMHFTSLAAVLHIVLALVAVVRRTDAIKCMIGWGQKGLEYQYGEEWPRDCSKRSTYCFRASTQDVTVAQTLVDFTWDPYYAIFYFKGCGGQWGTPMQRDNNWPYKGPLNGRINITTPAVVTGQGATQTMVLDYTCGSDYCSAARRSWGGGGGAWGAAEALSLFLVPVAVGAALLIASS